MSPLPWPFLISMIITCTLLVGFPGQVQGFDELYSNCSDFSCGKLGNITYPFREISQAIYCGYPGYEVECVGDVNLTIMIMSWKYLVLDIVWETRSMTIVRMDLLESVCPLQDGAFTLDLSLANYTSRDVNATVLFDCNPSDKLEPFIYHFNCSMNGDSRAGYLAFNQQYADLLTKNCDVGPDSMALVPVLKSSVSDLLSNTSSADQVLNKGFEVVWTLDMEDCTTCQGDMGRCAHNMTTNEFICLCPDGVHQTTCSSYSVPTDDPAPVPEAPPRTRFAITRSLVSYLSSMVGEVILSCRIDLIAIYLTPITVDNVVLELLYFYELIGIRPNHALPLFKIFR
ncbi:hypothetical protein CRG98_045844 [Punica granatum]|uniref:non-specific serine/threonine protein kinase n=1 Tax=Punica granatum TaxID=22663 RepID=A0A2I0HPV9_PUNGR|nr:hypothetical protein CRG98_045844 [Punica granatum]